MSESKPSLAALEREMLDAYAPALRAQALGAGWLLEVIRKEAAAKRAAMTPQEREIADLRAKVARLEARLEHARAALAGEDCGYGE